MLVAQRQNQCIRSCDLNLIPRCSDKDRGSNCGKRQTEVGKIHVIFDYLWYSRRKDARKRAIGIGRIRKLPARTRKPVTSISGVDVRVVTAGQLRHCITQAGSQKQKHAYLIPRDCCQASVMHLNEYLVVAAQIG
jgi:hypothetical protein